MMASNVELHSFICLLQFMDLSPENASTMLTAVQHVINLQYLNTKYMQIARALFTDR